MSCRLHVTTIYRVENYLFHFAWLYNCGILCASELPGILHILWTHLHFFFYAFILIAFFAWEIIMIPKRFESFKILCLEREYSRWGVDFACSWPGGLYCGIVYGPLWRITSSAVNPEHIIRRKPWALMSVVSPPLQKNNVSYNKWLFLVHVSQTSIYCHSL